jgi:hypothetical protein
MCRPLQGDPRLRAVLKDYRTGGLGKDDLREELALLSVGGHESEDMLRLLHASNWRWSPVEVTRLEDRLLRLSTLQLRQAWRQDAADAGGAPATAEAAPRFSLAVDSLLAGPVEGHFAETVNRARALVSYCLRNAPALGLRLADCQSLVWLLDPLDDELAVAVADSDSTTPVSVFADVAVRVARRWRDCPVRGHDYRGSQRCIAECARQQGLSHSEVERLELLSMQHYPALSNAASSTLLGALNEAIQRAWRRSALEAPRLINELTRSGVLRLPMADIAHLSVISRAAAALMGVPAAQRGVFELPHETGTSERIREARPLATTLLAAMEVLDETADLSEVVHTFTRLAAQWRRAATGPLKHLLTLLATMAEDGRLHPLFSEWLDYCAWRQDPVLLAAHELYLESGQSRLGWLEFWDTCTHVLDRGLLHLAEVDAPGSSQQSQHQPSSSQPAPQPSHLQPSASGASIMSFPLSPTNSPRIRAISDLPSPRTRTVSDLPSPSVRAMGDNPLQSPALFPLMSPVMGAMPSAGLQRQRSRPPPLAIAQQAPTDRRYLKEQMLKMDPSVVKQGIGTSVRHLRHAIDELRSKDERVVTATGARYLKVTRGAARVCITVEEARAAADICAGDARARRRGHRGSGAAVPRRRQRERAAGHAAQAQRPLASAAGAVVAEPGQPGRRRRYRRRDRVGAVGHWRAAACARDHLR